MEEKKNPHFPDWKIWILTSLAVSQIMTAVQIRQANQELWKAVIQQDEALVQSGQELVQQKQELAQLGQHLIEHQQNDILYKTTLNQIVQGLLGLLEPNS